MILIHSSLSHRWNLRMSVVIPAALWVKRARYQVLTFWLHIPLRHSRPQDTQYVCVSTVAMTCRGGEYAADVFSTESTTS